MNDHFDLIIPWALNLNLGNFAKVMVVGGVSASEDDEFSVVKTVEILDMSTLNWRQGLDIPSSITGTNLILINGRPALVGRYGSENQRKILRYTDKGEFLLKLSSRNTLK